MESAQPWINLPGEILLEILVKLPAKSLLRFSCICKTWRALIRNPYFINKHLHEYGRETDGRVVVLSWLDPKIGKYEHETLYHSHSQNDQEYSNRAGPLVDPNQDLPNNPSLSLYGSCRGFLCLSNPSGDGPVYLYNATTRECLTLSTSSFNGMGFGFGFDASSNDYKVIKIGNNPRKPGYDAEIYKVSRNSWSKLDFDLRFLDGIKNQVPVHLNGSFHWSVYVRSPRIPNTQRLIYTFDILTETFGWFKYPDEIDVYGVLAVLQDSLAYIAGQGLTSCQFAKSFDVWVMTEYGNHESWTKKYSLGPLPVWAAVLTCWNDGELLLQNADGYLMCCNLHKSSQDVRPFGRAYRYYLKAVIYQETLSSFRGRSS